MRHPVSCLGLATVGYRRFSLVATWRAENRPAPGHWSALMRVMNFHSP